jgi:hypothetical protein
VIRTGIWRSPDLAVAGFALPDNCIAILADRALGAGSTLAPVTVQRACRCGNTGLFRVADQIMPEGQPFAGLSQNARFDKLADRHYQLWNGQPAGSGEPVTGNRRRGP